MEPRLSISKASKGPFVSMIFQIIGASTLTIDFLQIEADSKVSVTYPDLKILTKYKQTLRFPYERESFKTAFMFCILWRYL